MYLDKHTQLGKLTCKASQQNVLLPNGDSARVLAKCKRVRWVRQGTCRSVNLYYVQMNPSLTTLWPKIAILYQLCSRLHTNTVVGYERCFGPSYVIPRNKAREPRNALQRILTWWSQVCKSQDFRLQNIQLNLSKSENEAHCVQESELLGVLHPCQEELLCTRKSGHWVAQPLMQTLSKVAIFLSPPVVSSRLAGTAASQW